jgi:hypothetical protein
MGSFANTVFSILLGWMQGLVSAIWSAFTGKEGESFFQFIGNNWIKIPVILCAVGAIVDFSVYFFRWQPYKVWRSFWRRLKNKGETPVEAGNEPQEEWKNDGADEPEERELSPRRQAEPDTDDDLSRWKVSEKEMPEAEPEAEITKAGYTVPLDSPYRKPGSRPGRRRLRVNLLGDADEEGEIHYYAPRPIVDHREAYHAPVYPEGWKKNGEQNS